MTPLTVGLNTGLAPLPSNLTETRQAGKERQDNNEDGTMAEMDHLKDYLQKEQEMLKNFKKYLRFMTQAQAQAITGAMKKTLSLEEMEKIADVIAANNTQENTGQVCFQPLQKYIHTKCQFVISPWLVQEILAYFIFQSKP